MTVRFISTSAKMKNNSIERMNEDRTINIEALSAHFAEMPTLFRSADFPSNIRMRERGGRKRTYAHATAVRAHRLDLSKRGWKGAFFSFVRG